MAEEEWAIVRLLAFFVPVPRLSRMYKPALQGLTLLTPGFMIYEKSKSHCLPIFFQNHSKENL